MSAIGLPPAYTNAWFCADPPGAICRRPGSMMLDHKEAARISVTTMIEPVAEALGNTVAISRKAYVHPALIEAVKERPRDPLGGIERPRARKWLSQCEVGLMQFLTKSAKRKPAAGAAA